jgi:hypothetical protein
MSLVI